MANSSAPDDDAFELEAMRKKDFQVSPSFSGVGLTIDFGSQNPEDIILNTEERLKQLRIPFIPIQGDDSTRIEQGAEVPHGQIPWRRSTRSSSKPQKQQMGIDPRGQIHLRRSTKSSSKLQKQQMGVEDLPLPAPSVLEEPSDIQSLPSPLAGCAALASLVSKIPRKLDFSIDNEKEKELTRATNYTHKYVTVETVNGVTPFSCTMENGTSMEDGLCSDLVDASGKVSDSSQVVKPLISTERGALGNVGLVEPSSGIHSKGWKNSNKTLEVGNTDATLEILITRRELNQPTISTRITRSSVKKSSQISNNDFPKEANTEGMKLRTRTTTRRLIHSAGCKVKEDISVTLKQGLAENNLNQTIETDSPVGNVSIPRSNVLQKESSMLTSEKAVSSPLDADIKLYVKESNDRQMRCAANTTQQTEGKVSGPGASSQGQKRKSTSSRKQELRFSPRLKVLPRTRSQCKS